MNPLEANVSLFIITFFAAIQYAFLSGVPASVSHFAFICVTNLVGFLIVLAMFFNELFRLDVKLVKQSAILSAELFGFNLFILLGAKNMDATVTACVLSSYFIFVPLFSFLLFNLLCAPCFAAIGAIKREMNSRKWTWFAIAYQCCFAWVIAFIVWQLGRLFAGGMSVVGLVLALAMLALLLWQLFKPYKEAQKLTVQ